MITEDDDSSPSTGLQDAKKLVQDDHVVAIVGDNSVADNSWAPYIASTGVPVVGGLAPSVPFLTNSDFFAIGASLPVQTVGVFNLAKAEGKKKVGVMYCVEIPLCAQVVPIGKGAAALTGLGFASIGISGTAPSYAAPCLTMKSGGVDALFVADNAQIVARVVAACAQQGYKPLVVSETTTADTTWLTNPAFDGAQLSSSNANYTDATLPGVAAFLTAMKKYAPGLTTSSEFGYDTFYPWLAGLLFQAAAKAADIGPTSTSADVKKGLYALKNETLGGLSAPLNFASGKPAFPTCYYGVTISGGKFASLNGGQDTCLTPTQASGLAAGLKKLL
jgi:branched-chain amino acid transport system substrate-binding protein